MLVPTRDDSPSCHSLTSRPGFPLSVLKKAVLAASGRGGADARDDVCAPENSPNLLVFVVPVFLGGLAQCAQLVGE